MKQLIEYTGKTDDGIDSYVIDGTIKGRHLTVASRKYIAATMRQGDPDTTDDKGRGYRIVHVGRATDDGSEQWVEHIAIADPDAAKLGRKGGAAKTEAKRAASSANGKLGGRPRKE